MLKQQHPAHSVPTDNPTIWQRLFEPSAAITDASARRQARLLASLMLAMAIILINGAFSTTFLLSLPAIPPVLLTFTLFVLMVYGLSRTAHYQVAAVFGVVVLTAIPFAIVLTSGNYSSEYLLISFIWTVLTALITSVFFSIRNTAIWVATLLAGVLLLPAVIPQIAFTSALLPAIFILSVSALILVITQYRNTLEGARLAEMQKTNDELQVIRSALEQRTVSLERRDKELLASVEVGSVVSSLLHADQILSQVINLIAERFGFYYVAVFTLNDTGTLATLREGTGEAGRILKERTYQVEVNERSMVGEAIAQRKAHIALDVGVNPARSADPWLPDTRSEIALPLIASNRVFGALDVQSRQPAAFDDSSAAVLQTMANQIAVALNNAEQFKQAKLQAQRQSNLNQFSRGLFSAASTEEFYQVLAADLKNIIPHDYLSLTLPQGSTLRDYLLQAAAEPVITEGPARSPQNTLCGRAFTTRRPAVSFNLKQDTQLDDVVELKQLGFQSMLSLPLNVGENILGTLNFASQNREAFSLENAAWLEQLGGQIAAALETRRLAQAQETNLRKMEALTRQMSSQGWAKRQQRQTAEATHYVRGGLEADLPASTPEIEAAIERGAAIKRSAPGDLASPYQSTLAVPIVLRGQVLGGLQVGEAHHAREWTEDELTFMQAVADQVALALDNARLIEATERRAERERIVADIGSRMFAANDLETIVQIAGEELGRILQVDRTEVKLSSAISEPAADAIISAHPN